MEIDIKAIAGDYLWIDEFRSIWFYCADKAKKSTVNKSAFINELNEIELVSELLNESVQTKYLDENKVNIINQNVVLKERSSKRTKQIAFRLDSVFHFIDEEDKKELLKRFRKYEMYVNFDKEIVLKKDTSRFEGVWRIEVR